ncbi:unnamed protein product [Heligmosomoides polygyrus]|uniref:Reverse transcriptase domain-containing protein n=1 Tax=Heligmosomoides polygyrus TaxID=6339 RepID=A0A183F7X3_HELPZ|nr:unnamed protein product [Heligmosomoides polygyrus]
MHRKKKITMKETEAASKKMKPGKTTGPDDVAADLWKSKFWHSAEWLAKFFNQVVPEKKKPVPWTLLHADDVMLASEDKGELEREVQAWCDRLERYGLRLNVKETEYLTTDVIESSSIKVKGIELPRTSVFKYLGSAVASDGNLMVEVNPPMSAAWFKWRSLTGLLCDKKIPERSK